MHPITRCLLALILLLAAAAAPADSGETLDSLMARRLSADTTFVDLVEPRTLRLRGTVEQLPAPGKTRYMTDTLVLRRITPRPEVGHKMWLRSAGGDRVMVYVADDVVGRIRRDSRPGSEIDVVSLYLWNSRHGPGLLVTGFEVVKVSRDRAIERFGGQR